MVIFPMTHSPVFKVMTLFEVEYLKNCAFWGQSYFRN